MGSVLASYDNMLASASDNGIWPVFYASSVPTGGTTAATSTSGLVSGFRFPDSITVPSLGAGLTGVVFPTFDVVMSLGVGSGFQGQGMGGIEYLLGTLTVSGNVFADGVAMPTKTVKGVSLQTCAEYLFVVVSAALTATTPVLTITYTNQAGTTLKTATMTLPTSPVANSAFLVNPHLASGDTGVQDITNLSISTGSAGTLKVYGLLALGIDPNGGTSAGTCGPDPLTVPMIPWTAAAGDIISFYGLVGVVTSSYDLYAHLVGIADN